MMNMVFFHSLHTLGVSCIKIKRVCPVFKLFYSGSHNADFVSNSSEPTFVPHEPEKVVFGIDLGNIRTSVMIIRSNEDRLKEGEDYKYYMPDCLRKYLLECKAKMLKNIPSVVSFTKDGRCLVGPAAAIRIIGNPLNTYGSSKCLIGRYYKDHVVQKIIEKRIGCKIFKSPNGYAHRTSPNSNRILTPSQITALILVKLKKLCETEDGLLMKNVVISTPAYFTDAQVQVTREAVQMAGLNVLKIINEPTAAILAYDGFKTENKTVVVYDFGGTF